MLILGLALVLAAPAIPRPRSGADATAHELARVLERGRLAAVRGGLEVRVELDAAGGAYRVLARTAEGADSLLGEGVLPTGPETGLETPGGRSGTVVRFGPLGRAEGGPVRVRDAERASAVVVDPWTGRVRVGAE